MTKQELEKVTFKYRYILDQLRENESVNTEDDLIENINNDNRQPWFNEFLNYFFTAAKNEQYYQDLLSELVSSTKVEIFNDDFKNAIIQSKKYSKSKAYKKYADNVIDFMYKVK